MKQLIKAVSIATALIAMPLVASAQDNETLPPSAEQNVESGPGAGKCMGMHGRGPGRHQGGPCNMPVFADLDQDGDSFISNDEFLAFHAARIQERAQQGREMKNAANATAFVDMDLDGDGRLSRDEFAAHQAQMRAGGHCCGM